MTAAPQHGGPAVEPQAQFLLLRAVTFRTAMDQHRAHVPLEAAENVPTKDTPHDDAARISDIERLVVLVAKLPQREQELLALKYGAEATNRAIAELTGLSESNVGTILHRVVQALRRDW